MKKAWIVAGLKLGVGLLLLSGVVGMRIFTAPAGGVESGVAELEQLQSTLAKAASAAEAMNGSAGASDPDETAASVPPAGGDAGDLSGRMVACQLGGARQFMSGADCAMRGGRATEI